MGSLPVLERVRTRTRTHTHWTRTQEPSVGESNKIL